MVFEKVIMSGTIRFGTPLLDKGSFIMDLSYAQKILDMEDGAGELLGFLDNEIYNPIRAEEIKISGLKLSLAENEGIWEVNSNVWDIRDILSDCNKSNDVLSSFSGCKFNSFDTIEWKSKASSLNMVISLFTDSERLSFSNALDSFLNACLIFFSELLYDLPTQYDGSRIRV